MQSQEREEECYIASKKRRERVRGFRRHFVVKCLPGNYHASDVYDERHKVEAADDDNAAAEKERV